MLGIKPCYFLGRPEGLNGGGGGWGMGVGVPLTVDG